MRVFSFRFHSIQVFLTLAVAGTVLAAFAGRILFAEDPLERADVIYVLAGARADRWLEASDLYKEGYAPRILLSTGGTDAAEEILRARGIRLPTDGEFAREGLRQVGVPADAVILPEGRSDNTAAEATQFARFAAARSWRTAILVTSKFHTRRAGLAVRRTLRGTGIRVIVRASRYDSFRTRAWWMDRYSSRMVLFEFPKLIAYACGLGE
jgi:uncharacterized SAM-binding protein YcdF (DUF218 family)